MSEPLCDGTESITGTWGCQARILPILGPQFAYSGEKTSRAKGAVNGFRKCILWDELPLHSNLEHGIAGAATHG
jgi:hypothetical protein